MVIQNTALNGQALSGFTFNGKETGIMYKGSTIFERDGYTDGCIARYIGSRNMKSGFDPNTVVWRDVIGNHDLYLDPGSLTSARYWEPDCFVSKKTGSTWFTLAGEIPPPFSVENCTVEIVMMPTDDGPSGGGDIFGFNGRNTSPYESWGAELYTKNLRLYVLETSTYGQTGANQALSLNTVYSFSAQNQPYNNGQGKKQLWLSGQKKIDMARTAQRLYVSDENPNRFNAVGNGGAFPVVTQMFFGRIYEMRIYPFTLTQEQILQNYEQDKLIYGVA